ncbi:hypothetical protein HYFRA_00006692 [Hymenoscyphus fraxineus]|uniref:Endonuclease/exonuclease/phosphatase domain-containing protein n=1 Tax=Hymenoscyphus fraxineus TaxID=746836 RepID=A0A9N9KT88_9HELO|nr:hypothetical protein HYFRA_00006692 [Hymenoscyphus fraxineus]
MQSSYLLTLLLFAVNAFAVTLPLRIVSWNVRFDADASTRQDGEKPWSTIFCVIWSEICRKPHVIELLKNQAANTASPTIIGLQEVLDNQLEDIKSGLGSTWQHIGFGRDDGKKSGEYSPILYNTDALTLVFSEMKWLSPTPDEVSFGWGAGSRRVVTIGIFEDKATGKRFIHANTHLDNVSSEARSEGIKVVASRIKAVREQFGPLGATLTGDFNSEPNQDAYQTLDNMKLLTEVSKSEAVKIGNLDLTYTGFESEAGFSRIDFVWFGPTEQQFYAAQSWEVVSNVVDGVFISDHRLVVADLTAL